MRERCRDRSADREEARPTAAHAAAPTEVTLFGQKYTLERHSLAGKYANGLSVTQPDSDDKTTTVRFVQGDTPAHDRLYVGCFSAEDASLIYDQFYLLTGPATESQTIPYDTSQDPFDLQQIGANEYLILGANPLNRGADRTNQILYKVMITPPADPATAGPESIKVQVEAGETLLDENATPAVDPLNVGAGGIVAVTAGREVAPSLPRLYFTDRGGELITATPVVAASAAPTAGP